MGRITIERGDNQQPPYACECCGNLSHSSYGFIHSDDSAHAVYFARWTERHEGGPSVTMLISMGAWGTGDPRPGARASMALRAWLLDGEVVYTVLDAGDTAWADREQVLGTMLSRQEGLAHPGRDEFFHLAEHVMGDDPSVRAALHAG
jgi:hypothetical protein